MKNNNIFTYCFLLLILLITFSSCAPPVTTVGQFPEGYSIIEAQHAQLKVNESFTYNFILYNTSTGLSLNNSTGITCRMFVANSSGNLIFQSNVTYTPDDYWNVIIPGGVLVKRGLYNYGVDCMDGLGGALAGSLYITENGNDYNEYTAGVIIGLLVFFCFLFFGLFQLTHKINFEQWHSKIIRQYENRNFVKFVLGSMIYVVMKNSYVLYYLLGLPIISLINELAFTFNIESLILFAPTLSFIYTFGVVILGVVFLSNVQEWIMDLFKEISDMKWGFKS